MDVCVNVWMNGGPEIVRAIPGGVVRDEEYINIVSKLLYSVHSIRCWARRQAGQSRPNDTYVPIPQYLGYIASR